MSRQHQKYLLYALLGLLVLLFAYSSWHVGSYLVESQKSASRFDTLSEKVEQVRDDQENMPLPPESEEGNILPEYRELYEENPDLVGWIQIAGTDINYPVMQTPEQKSYYLRRDFDGSYSTHGCIFVQEECDVEAPSDNVTIYGHRMKDGSMFADLAGYADPDFWDVYRQIQFDSLTQRRSYEIFAVFKTSATPGYGLEYHTFINAEDAEEFDRFISRCKALSFYETGITPVWGDKIICLSTCDYSLENGRLVVAAVLRES